MPVKAVDKSTEYDAYSLKYAFNLIGVRIV